MEYESNTYGQVWEDIIPFESNNAIKFPVESFNCIPFLSKFLNQVATFTQTDVAMASTILLPVLSNCIQKKVNVNVSVTKKPTDSGYQEQLSLFAMVALGSGERKSPVFKILTNPLRCFQFQKNEEIEPEIKRYIHKLELLKEQIKAQKRIIASPKGKNKDLARQILNELIEQEIHLKPIFKKSLIENDITLERTASLMYENEGRLGIFSDEGGIIKTWAGKYDSNDIEIILSGYSGTGFSIRRQTREEFDIKEPALSVAIATQYGTLNDILDNSGYYANNSSLILSLCYKNAVNFKPALVGNSLNQDHIFSQDELKKAGKDEAIVNSIYNIRLIQASSNITKSNTQCH